MDLTTVEGDGNSSTVAESVAKPERRFNCQCCNQASQTGQIIGYPLAKLGINRMLAVNDTDPCDIKDARLCLRCLGKLIAWRKASRKAGRRPKTVGMVWPRLVLFIDRDPSVYTEHGHKKVKTAKIYCLDHRGRRGILFCDWCKSAQSRRPWNMIWAPKPDRPTKFCVTKLHC